MPIRKLYFLPFLTTCALLYASCKSRTKFDLLPSSYTGIHFNNQVIETDSQNVFNTSNMYNGGGVGIGDFNNDGLPDIYFTGNKVSNKLYLNQGDFRFRDITEEAAVDGKGEWCRGVSVIDINNDGWMDIYICATLKKDPRSRQNLLYVNQGLDKKGIPHFREMAKEYGLADTVYSTMAAFFDYDNDGDLDMYLAVNEIPFGDNPAQFRRVHTDGSFPSTGKLYRNDWSDSLKHPVFTDVSRKAGISIEGFTHGVTIADINRDGWKDIYVTNDFLSSNILYINNHDGTFTNQATTYLKHTSANAMGQDIADINNDGLADIIELDMSPEDNYRRKTMMNPYNYRTYQNFDIFGYSQQYVRNTLQLNQGPRPLPGDSIGPPIFSEIGFLAGINATDWSWAPLVADFDNDGYRDLIIMNGYAKDVTDLDFVMYRNKASRLISRQQLLGKIPEVKLHNYAFRNNGDLSFTDVSTAWGLTVPRFSNGAAYADLDNDGDLDLVVNTINDEALVFRNRSREEKKEDNHFLDIRFVGDSGNIHGLGAWAEWQDSSGHRQVYENTPYRGYLSSVTDRAHFGLGRHLSVDSLVIRWPNGKMQVLGKVASDQVLTVDIRNAHLAYSFAQTSQGRLLPSSARATGTTLPLFREITDSVNIHYRHEQKDFIDFNIQKLLPHKFSEQGPALAVGDLDGNGLDDLVVGGAACHSAQLFLQQKNGQFIQRALTGDTTSKQADDGGMLLFDADGDGDLDLYIASGGYANAPNSPAYQDRIYRNDGKGNFLLETTALPPNFTSKACVRAADFDHDGDLDLFIAGRVDPWNYPQPVSSFIYRNDSRDGHIRFTDVTATVAGDLRQIGMVTDALWTDIDKDGWPDLILTGEWMPITFLKNEGGRFRNITSTTGVGGETGWWRSIVAGDFDNDGNMDYIVGNLGLNSFYRTSKTEPVRAYGKDFDHNGIYDMILSLYLPDRDGLRKEFPAQGRDDLIRQINALRHEFPDYHSFGIATMDEILPADQRKDALVLQANNFTSSLLRNLGNGHFMLTPLPIEAQFAPVNGMVAGDFDGDGNLDIIIIGNDYGGEPQVGRYDASNGLFLRGDGKGHFKSLSILQSGLFLPGNGRALATLRAASGKRLLAATQNKGPLQLFELISSSHPANHARP